MSAITSVASRLIREENGAALVEYSVLVALITVAVVALIGSVGGKVKTAWTSLNAALP